jgi:aspartate racemase
MEVMQGWANQRLGRTINSLKAYLHTVDCHQLVQVTAHRNWAAAEALMEEALIGLRDCGADFAVITSATGSSYAEAIKSRVGLPLLNITDVAIRALLASGHKSAGLLSTIRTVESNLFQKAAEREGLTILTPDSEIAAALEKVIFEELVPGRITEHGLSTVALAVESFAQRKAQAVFFACTDLTHTIAPLGSRLVLPILDTTVLHARAAADCALGDSLPTLSGKG